MLLLYILYSYIQQYINFIFCRTYTYPKYYTKHLFFNNNTTKETHILRILIYNYNYHLLNYHSSIYF